MKFRLRESIDLSPITNSTKAQKALGKHGAYTSKASAAAGNDNIGKTTKYLGKANKAGARVLDYLYTNPDNKAKIEKNKEIFLRELVGSEDGKLSDRFQFIASLPDEAYEDKARLKYFVSKMDNGSIPVPSYAQQELPPEGRGGGVDDFDRDRSMDDSISTPSSGQYILTEDGDGDYFIPSNNKNSLFYVRDLWKTSEDFERILDIYCILNKKATARKFLPEEVIKRVESDPTILTNLFLQSDGGVTSSGDARRIDSMPNIRKKAEALARGDENTDSAQSAANDNGEVEERSIQELASDYAEPSEWRMMSSLVDAYYDTVDVDPGYGKKLDKDGFYLPMLYSMYSAYKTYEKAADKGSVSANIKNKHDIFQKMMTVKKFTEEDQKSIAKFIMETISDQYRKGKIVLPRRRGSTSGDASEG